MNASALIPRPGSTLWRASGDPRVLTAAGYALVMQVAHPTVAAGVREHSIYATDPWGRLVRTLDYTYSMVFGGPAVAEATGRRLREMHTQIRGVTPEGRRYHALEPEAFAWVHATLIEATVTAHRRFGTQLSAAEIDSIYAEWLDLGRLIGLRERDLPSSWESFMAYFRQMETERLESSDVVDGVIGALTKPKAPPVALLPDPLWRVARLPLGRLTSLATVGLLSSPLRAKLGLTWTPAQDLQLRALGAAARSCTALMPERMRVVGPAYLRRRGIAVEANVTAADPDERGIAA